MCVPASLMNVEDGEDVFIPYVLTAGHCISTDDSASSVVGYWSYQSSTCGGSATSSDLQRFGRC